MRTYIIAEIGPNHNGSVDLAVEMVKKLSVIGVDAIKFQLANPDELYSLDSYKVDYQKRNDDSQTPVEMSRKNQLTHKEHRILHDLCKELKVEYLCTAFDIGSLKFLNEELNISRFKVPSGEILSADLLAYMSQFSKPIILSTGMATFGEIDKTISLLNLDKKKDITILHCISNYPAPFEDVNLNVMLELHSRFGYPVGFSDHTLGNESAIAAVALGARLIEKHVTFDKNAAGPDHKASITIDEFRDLVSSIRRIEMVLGNKEKVFSDDEEKIKQAVRKSLIAKTDLPSGHILKPSDVCFKRPGSGISPLDLEVYIGEELATPVAANHLIRRECFKRKI